MVCTIVKHMVFIILHYVNTFQHNHYHPIHLLLDVGLSHPIPCHSHSYPPAISDAFQIIGPASRLASDTASVSLRPPLWNLSSPSSGVSSSENVSSPLPLQLAYLERNYVKKNTLESIEKVKKLRNIIMKVVHYMFFLNRVKYLLYLH